MFLPSLKGRVKVLRWREFAEAFLDCGQGIACLGRIGAAGLGHIWTSAAAFAAELFGADLHQIDGVDLVFQIIRHADDKGCLAICYGDEGDDA